jgi:ribosomal protein S18 acetylase RimI-like enzyme
MNIRRAKRDDAGDLAQLIDIAGEGIPSLLWSDMAQPGETAMQAGMKRAAREDGGFSYRNATVAEEDGRVMAMLLDYRQPDPYEVGEVADLPGMIRPLIELEALAPGSWYVNAVATYEAYRGRGLATALLELSRQAAIDDGAGSMSIIVARENAPARRLYERLGYKDKASRPIVHYHGCVYSGDWVLMVRDL